MKKYTFILGLALLFPVLAGCGDDKDAKHTITFHQENAEDVSIEFDRNTKQSQIEINEPTLKGKEGYTVAWEEYSIEGKTTSFTVNAIYSPITYYVNFSAQGTLVDSVPFTVSDITGPNSKLPAEKTPAVPTDSWSNGYWENYSLSLNDIDVKAMYDNLKKYTVKFMVQGAQVGPDVEFTKNDIDSEGKLRMEKIPAEVLNYKVEHHDISWDFTIKQGGNAIIEARLDLHAYYLSFVDFEGEQIGEQVPYYYNSTWASVNKPAVPTKEGYNTNWPAEVTLSKVDEVQVVNPEKTGKKYTVQFEGYLDSQEVTFGEPYELIHKSSITTRWAIGDVVIADSGTWDYPNNADLSKKKVNKFSFEGGDVPSFIDVSKSQNLSSVSVVSGAGLNDSNALKVVVNKNEDFGLYVAKSTLDEVFEDSNVKTLNIVAKSNIKNNNFRHRTNEKNVCYEANDSKYGINLEYKVFSFTREMYNNHKDSTDFIVYGGVGGSKENPVSCAGEEIYIDSFIFNGNDSIGYEVNSFEDGYMEYIENGANTQYRYYHTYTIDPILTSYFFAQYSVNVVSVTGSYNYEHVTEGIRSMSFQKGNGYIALYLSPALNTYLKSSASKKITFDFWSSCGINSTSSVKNLTDGMNNPFGKAQPAEQFVTYELDATTQITNDGRFLIIQGSTAGTFCFDNFRIVEE